MHKLTTIENKVVSFIPNSDTGRITGRELVSLTGLDHRTLFSVIASLRRKGVPVIGDRASASCGYYIPVTDKARKAGTVALKRNLNELNTILHDTLNADLDNWKDLVGYESATA